MTHSLIGADRGTNIRVVGVALASVVVLVAALTAARVHDPASPMLAASGPSVVKPEMVTTFTEDGRRGAVR